MQNGDGVFSANVVADGQRIHRVIGRKSDGTMRTQIEDFIARIESDAKFERLARPGAASVSCALHVAARRYLDKLEEEGGEHRVAMR
jgi:hypothetical protein